MVITPTKREWGKVYGECICKNFRITPDWKCVDFRINPKFNRQEQEEIMRHYAAQHAFDVCEWCRCFKPAANDEGGK